MGKKLTPKQRKFINAYIKTGNATESARIAGYSETNVKQQGTDNLANTIIKAEIDKRMAKKDKELIADGDEILTFLTSVMRNQVTEQVVVVESKGDYMSLARTIDKDVNVKDRVKAGELLGKRHGLWAKQENQDMLDSINDNLVALGDIIMQPQPRHKIDINNETDEDK